MQEVIPHPFLSAHHGVDGVEELGARVLRGSIVDRAEVRDLQCVVGKLARKELAHAHVGLVREVAQLLDGRLPGTIELGMVFGESLDDLLVGKAAAGNGPFKHIDVQRCHLAASFPCHQVLLPRLYGATKRDATA